MKVDYDRDDDVLHVTTESWAVTSASLLDDPNVVVELATTNGHDVVGLLVIWASSYVRSGHDAETDTLRMGKTTHAPDLITRNGDIVVYWRVNEDDPDGFQDPIGVTIERASVYLAKASLEMVDVRS